MGGVPGTNLPCQNKGAFAAQSGKSHRHSDSEDCEETAVLGTRPAEDATLASEGTLFSHSTQSLGDVVLGLVLPEAYNSWPHGLDPGATPGL